MGEPEAPYQRAMVVAAHADDAEFGCAGTVAKLCGDGVEVAYVVCTDSSKGSDDREMTPERLAAIRCQEQQAAAKVLGVKHVVFLGYPDAMLQPNLELRKDITREIRRYRPDILICQNPLRSFHLSAYVGHPDHLAAGEAALAAVYPTARDRLTFPELLAQGLEPHKVREVWLTGHEEPDLWIDVTGTMDLAITALKQHTSQINGRDIDSRMREWRRRTGERYGVQYAEAFRHFHLG